MRHYIGLHPSSMPLSHHGESDEWTDDSPEGLCGVRAGGFEPFDTSRGNAGGRCLEMVGVQGGGVELCAYCDPTDSMSSRMSDKLTGL